ncbi:craniofacial development protein 2-like [Penaeus chinensis]|uniref:craniofacial development protein 2-like n=1 Tax=Penaeus chinensis TaxID=139456 RepID=UPI001FB80571|nr:craniofacial development protein 2-like [Penaeus chinensis]
MGVNLDRKSGDGAPKAVWQHTVTPATPATLLVPKLYRYSSFPWICQLCRRKRAPGAISDGGRDHCSPTKQLPPASSWAAPSHLGNKYKRKSSEIPCLRFATWNVRTMYPGLSSDIQQDARKTAVSDRELSRLSVDIACLQETSLADSRTLREESYTFFWKSKPPEEPRQHDVEAPTAGTERILTLRLSTSSGSATIISVYAPTLYSTHEDKDQFYGALDDVISRTPSTDALYLLGDFNARVGADHEAWPSCLGAYGCGKMNDNGQCLLELCSYLGLCVINTFFLCKEIHQVSWRHPRSRHWHQLDLVLIRRKDFASVSSPTPTTVLTTTLTIPSSPQGRRLKTIPQTSFGPTCGTQSTVQPSPLTGRRNTER